jgi:hypothetical protein
MGNFSLILGPCTASLENKEEYSIHYLILWLKKKSEEKLFKGMVSRDGVSTETIGVKFRPKESTMYVCILHMETWDWRVPRQKFKTQQTGDLSM